MTKMRFHAAIVLLLCAFYLYSPQTVAESKQILASKLSDNAYILRFSDSWTNIGLLKTGKGIVLIDTAAGKQNLGELSSFIDHTFQYSSCFVLNTHGHPDHTSGNEYFMSKGCSLLDNADELGEIQELTFDSHTASDSVFYHKESNSIFVGDIYETRGRALPAFWSGGMAGLDKAIEGILALGDRKTIVVPGHGAQASKDELESFRKNAADLVSRVSELNDNGLSASEMSDDQHIGAIMERFNINGLKPFITKQSLTGYLEKTITTLQVR